MYNASTHAHAHHFICTSNEIIMKSAMIDDNEFSLSHVIHGVVLHVSLSSVQLGSVPFRHVYY